MANVRINHALTNDYDCDYNDYSNNNRVKAFPFICCKEIKVNFHNFLPQLFLYNVINTLIHFHSPPSPEKKGAAIIKIKKEEKEKYSNRKLVLSY